MTSNKMLLINDLKRHYEANRVLLDHAVQRVLTSGWYILGPEVEEFEKEFAAFCGVKHCKTVGNGTDALEIALRAIGIKPNDKVITVANAGMYSSTAIFATGASPKYIDVDENSALLNAGLLDQVISSDTRAIIVTHLFGQMANIEKIIEIAKQYDCPVIEDCAQAHGVTLNGSRSGSFGLMGCFSFYPTKNLGAIGDGGAIVTNDQLVAEKIQGLRQYGWQKKYRVSFFGGRNSRMDELQAAILRTKLPFLDKWNSRRKQICSIYSQQINHSAIRHFLRTKENYVGHLYVVRSDRREQLRSFLANNGICSDVHYPVPDHLQTSVSENCHDVNLPVTELLAKEILTLPCFPEMTDTEVQFVIDNCNKWIP